MTSHNNTHQHLGAAVSLYKLLWVLALLGVETIGGQKLRSYDFSLIMLFRSLLRFAHYAFSLNTRFRSLLRFAHYAFSLITSFRSKRDFAHYTVWLLFGTSEIIWDQRNNLGNCEIIWEPIFKTICLVNIWVNRQSNGSAGIPRLVCAERCVNRVYIPAVKKKFAGGTLLTRALHGRGAASLSKAERPAKPTQKFG
jgi:hypothetical protein